MKYLQLLQYSIKTDEELSYEVKVERSSDYTIKVFASGIVVRYPSYAQDVKCYTEVINDKQVNIIKGDNAEILIVPEENTVIIGNNNSIYCIGERDNIFTKGLNNIIHNIAESLRHI